MRKPFVHSLPRMAYFVLTLALLLGCEKKSVDSYISDLHSRDKFNGVLLIGTRDGVKYSRALGFADHTQQSLLTVQHRFQIGSIYKEFPGVAIMQLVERNRLSLDVPISAYVKELPDWSNTVTVRHLLSYSSGIPNVPWGDLFQSGNPVTMAGILLELDKIKALEFEPGKKYLYSNYNSILLIRIVEVISGMTFEEYCREHLFEPADMKTAVFMDKYPYLDTHLVASPFSRDQEPDSYEFETRELMLNVSAEDIYFWLAFLHVTKPLSEESMSVLSGSLGEQSALGVLQWDNGVIRHHHHGSSGNFEATVRYASDQDRFLVILTNQNNGNVSDIADELESLPL